MKQNDQTLQITIQSTRGAKEFSFPKQAKVAEVIAQAIVAFGFAQGDNFQLALADNPAETLQPERPLVSYHIVDGTILILTATGSGV
jgi:basic membrane lipoprotein Med (substrate-binding protein (PBP1-ABC) superfamily)